MSCRAATPPLSPETSTPPSRKSSTDGIGAAALYSGLRRPRRRSSPPSCSPATLAAWHGQRACSPTISWLLFSDTEGAKAGPRPSIQWILESRKGLPSMQG